MKLSEVPVFILAGGMGTRLSEETQLKPKPMVEIGGIPILVHIMRHYYSFGFNDFVICAGYRSWDIKQFFLNYEFRINDLEIDHRDRGNLPPVTFGACISQERWRVRVLDTGVECMTGGRLTRAFDQIFRDEPFDDFALTYGDGLCDINLKDEYTFHKSHSKIGTVLGVKQQTRFGVLDIGSDNQVHGFLEKPDDRHQIINGGFFFLRRAIRSYLSPDPTQIFEREPLERLAKDGQLMTYLHEGFWHPMDTLRDKTQLGELWQRGAAPWNRPRAASVPSAPTYSA